MRFLTLSFLQHAAPHFKHQLFKSIFVFLQNSHLPFEEHVANCFAIASVASWHARLLDKAASQDRLRSWTEWAEAQLDKCGRELYQWLRKSEQASWTPTTALLKDGRVVADPLGLLGSERAKWQELWQVCSEPVGFDGVFRPASLK